MDGKKKLLKGSKSADTTYKEQNPELKYHSSNAIGISRLDEVAAVATVTISRSNQK